MVFLRGGGGWNLRPIPYLILYPLLPHPFLVQDLLDARGSSIHLSDEAKLNLYETIGFLIGMPGVPLDKQVGHVLCRVVPFSAVRGFVVSLPNFDSVIRHHHHHHLTV